MSPFVINIRVGKKKLTQVFYSPLVCSRIQHSLPGVADADWSVADADPAVPSYGGAHVPGALLHQV